MENLPKLKFKSGLTLIVFICLLVVIYKVTKYTSSKKSFPKAADVVKDGQTLPKIKPQKRTNDLPVSTPPQGSQVKPVLSPLPVVSPIVKIKHEATMFELCEESWREFVQRNILDLQNDIVRGRPLLSQICLDQMKKEVQFSQIKKFIDDCQLNQSPFEMRELEQVCLTELQSFRAYIFREFKKNAKDSQEFDVSEVATQLLGGFLNLESLSRDELDQNISIADALIARDPNVYAAYKGKLLSLLMKELKFKQAVDISVYEDLYSELLSFGGLSEKDQVLAELQSVADANAGVLNEAIETRLNASELSGIDSDLVQIPFLRLKALGNSESLAEMAQDYITAYPNSYIGYLYLAEASWSTGNKAEAVSIFKKAPGNLLSDEAAFDFIRQIESKPVLDSISEMKLE